MYRPALKLSPTGVPVLTKVQLERIAERYTQEYTAQMKSESPQLDPIAFARQILQLDLQYQWLSHNGCYLGAAVFRDDTVIPVFVPEKNAAATIIVPKDTILVDQSLKQEEMQSGEQFTIMHECSHQILHWGYYRKQDATPCRSEAVQPNYCPREWTDEDRMEWQANYLASALLMPLSALNDMIQEQDLLGYYEHRIGRGVSPIAAMRQAASDVAFWFGVSPTMAKIRLQGIGFGKKSEETASGF